jgi:hypothetical protein
MPSVFSLFRSVGAVLAGYGVIVVGTILTFEVALGGIGYGKSSWLELALATLGALLSGILGGLVTARLAAQRPLAHAVGILLPLAADTAYVVTSGISKDPVWFDLGGSACLAAGAIAGGLLFQAWRSSRERGLAASQGGASQGE